MKKFAALFLCLVLLLSLSVSALADEIILAHDKLVHLPGR